MPLIRFCAVALAVAVAALGATASSATAATRSYTLVISPASVSGGSSTAFNFALTNTSSSATRLGSANFTPPPGFQVTAASLPKGSPGTATVVGGVVQLRSLALVPKASVNVSVTASAPETCGITTNTWGSAAMQEPNFTGQTLTLQADDSSLTTQTTTNCTTTTSCPQNQSCQTKVTTSTSSLEVTAVPGSNGPNSGTLTESADIGNPLQCEGYTAQDPNWFSFLTSSSNRRKLLTYTIIPPGPSSEPVGSTQFCLGSATEFTTRSGTPAPAGTLPDGSSGFIGLLPDCPVSEPCVLSRGTSADPSSPVGFDIVLHVEIPAGMTGDPWGRA